MLHTGKSAFMAACALVAFTVAGHAYPNGTVTMIVPFSAGGTNDSVARAFAPELASALGNNVVVNNADGAAGTVGANEIVSAKPDGLKIGFVPLGPVTVQNHLRDLPYDIESWQPICNIYQSNLVLVTNKNGPLQSVEDLMEKGTITYGSTGPGTINHLASAATVGALDLEGRHVPDKGAGPAMLSLANGTIDLFADTPVIVTRYDVTPIAALSEERLPEVPDVPTMKELGHDLQFSLWAGLFVSAEVPDDVVEELTQACDTAVNSDGFKASADKIGINLKPMIGQEFTDFVHSEYESMKDVVNAVGIKK